jgi:hypothetical protein
MEIETSWSKERRTGTGSFVAVLMVIGAIAAVAFGWWSVGTAPLEKRVSQAPPSVTSPDTTMQPRTTIPEGGTSVTL